MSAYSLAASCFQWDQLCLLWQTGSSAPHQPLGRLLICFRCSVVSHRASLSFPLSFPVLTVGLAGSGPVVGAEPGLCLLLAQLQLLGVGEQRPAGVSESLLLPGPVLTDVDRHPGRPGGVAAHLWAGLQVTCLVLLESQAEEPRHY